jgi:RNA-directed DNA polymerase
MAEGPQRLSAITSSMTTHPDLYGFEHLWHQYRRCRRNKRNTINQLRFELDAEAQLLTLQHELRAHTYQPV